MLFIYSASLKLYIREKPSGGRGSTGGSEMMAGRDTEKEREREKAAAVLELMSACQIRNTMHLRQNKKRGG